MGIARLSDVLINQRCVLIAAAALSLMFLITSRTAAMKLSSTNHACPSSCTCKAPLIACQDRVPEIVPDTIEEVELDVTYMSNFGSAMLFYPGMFCNITWKHVHTLKLIIYSWPTSKFHRYDNNFNCLEQIQTLKLESSIGWRDFNGLSNVTTLYISKPYFEYSKRFLLNIFSNSTNFPKLNNFIFSTKLFLDIVLTDEFIRVLSTRPITMLDFSHSNVEFNFREKSKLCDSLTSLILRDSNLRINSIPRSCPSLDFVDLSGVNFVTTFFKYECSIDYFTYWYDILSVRVVYLNRVFVLPSDAKVLTECTILFNWRFDSEHALEELHFTQNVLPIFDLQFDCHSLRYINLSHNHIEIIASHVFTRLPSISKIDLSHNNLRQMTAKGERSSDLLKDNLNLRIIDLSFNKISYISGDIFASSINLQEIKLSHNLLTQIDLRVSFFYMLNLTLLDLQYNKIQNLNSNSRQAIEGLYEHQQQRQSVANNTTSPSLVVLLEGNPFSCTCSSQAFLEWFANFPMFDSTRDNYQCQLNGQKYAMKKAASEAAMDDCERPKRERRTILLSTIIPGISALVVTLILRSLYKRRKRRLLEQRLQDQLQLVQENNTTSMFPVFLSYSSLDSTFVVTHVREPLQRELQAITQADRDLVCDADLHFIPGHNIYQEMSRCIEESAVFVAVISENYCKSDHCQIEIAEARTTGKPILLIFKEHVEEDKMKIVIKEIFHNFTRVKFVKEGDSYRIEPSWQQICESIIQLM